jgi:hypothetical protein
LHMDVKREEKGEAKYDPEVSGCMTGEKRLQLVTWM